MTWPRYRELEGYWKIYPPIGAAVGSFVTRDDSGGRAAPAASAPPATTGERGTMEDLAREMGADPSFRVR